MCGSTAVASIPLTWMEAYCTAAADDEEANVTMNNPSSPSESSFYVSGLNISIKEKRCNITSNDRSFGCPIICTDIYSQWYFVHYSVDTTNNSWYHQAHWLIGMPNLSIITSNVFIKNKVTWRTSRLGPHWKSRIFQTGEGRQPQGEGGRRHIIWPISPKLHINEENWAEGVFLCYILPSGGSRISQMLCADPRGGPQPIILSDLCRKLHENEIENLERIFNLQWKIKNSKK